MNFNDGFAFIPLYATAVMCLAIFVLLIISKIRKTANVSFIALIATAIIGGISVFCATQKVPEGTKTTGLGIIAVAMAFSAFLFLIYSVILVLMEPKKAESSAAKESDSKKKENSVLMNVLDITQEDVKLLDINKEFSTKAAECIGQDEGLSQVLDHAIKTAVKVTNSDGGCILMIDDFDDVISVKALTGDFPPPYKLPDDMPHKPMRVSTNFKYASFQLGENVFGHVATSGKAELIDRPENDKRIFQNGPEEFLKSAGYIFAPLKINDKVSGVICLSRNYGAETFTEDDLHVVEQIGEYAAAAVKSLTAVKDVIEKSERNKESEIAARIQDMLHPAKLPVIPGIQIGTVFNPTEGVCGDNYDIIPCRKDRISFIMNDIAGKGTNSMVIMIMIRAMFRLVVNTKQSAGTILTWANKGICGESFSTDHFASCALINYDPETKKIQYSTSGSSSILYYNAREDEIRLISERTEPIGVDKTSEYKDFTKELSSGDILAAYSDGLVEALNVHGEQYSRETLMKLIKANHGSSGKDIANLIKSDIKKFIGNANQHDDQTLLLIKIQ